MILLKIHCTLLYYKDFFFQFNVSDGNSDVNKMLKFRVSNVHFPLYTTYILYRERTKPNNDITCIENYRYTCVVLQSNIWLDTFSIPMEITRVVVAVAERSLWRVL